MVISGTSIGTIWQVRVAALLLVLYFSIVGWRRPAFALGSLSVTAAIALATLAWTGHGAADEGLLGWVHLGADITHLLAAGIRSEEHTSELQSLMRISYAVFCLKKKQILHQCDTFTATYTISNHRPNTTTS